MPAINKPALSAFQRKQKMSLSQTYFLAHTARGKLSKEAARADHDLRLLVGHANLLDGLMVDLADAEREQESWFNQTVREAARPKAEAKRVTWADNLPTVTEDADADSDSESEVDEDDMIITTATTAQRAATTVTEIDLDSDDEEADDDDVPRLQLTRTPSRSSPPELTHGHESESESEDEEMPPSPPAPRMEFARAAATKPSESLPMEHDEALYADGFYLPSQPQAIAAY